MESRVRRSGYGSQIWSTCALYGARAMDTSHSFAALCVLLAVRVRKLISKFFYWSLSPILPLDRLQEPFFHKLHRPKIPKIETGAGSSGAKRALKEGRCPSSADRRSLARFIFVLFSL